MTWLLILYIGTTSTGQPQLIIKYFEDEPSCKYDGGQIEALERLNGNYGVWFECIKRS